jgi:hypothetical protein
LKWHTRLQTIALLVVLVKTLVLATASKKATESTLSTLMNAFLAVHVPAHVLLAHLLKNNSST